MTARFAIQDTPITGLRVLQRNPVGDNRGYLERMYCADDLRGLLPETKGIAQINHTLTPKCGTIRGLHFQYPPFAEVKFVSCLRGMVFDVAVDLRAGSRTFLHWHGEVLSSDNHRTMVIPEGFAHGFQTLTDECGMLYFHTAAYQPGAEGGLSPQDPWLKIAWPLAVTELSPRDAAHAPITGEFTGIAL